MYKIFAEILKRYIAKDKQVLLDILHYRGVIDSVGIVNVGLIKKCANNGATKFKTMIEKGVLPIKLDMIVDTIENHANKKDELELFCLIFFYCEIYDKELPDLMLPSTAHEEVFEIYSNQFLLQLRSNIIKV